MQLSALQSECRRRFRDPNQKIVDNTGWTAYINKAYHDVQTASPFWPWMDKTDSAAVSVTAGSRSGTLPTDVWAITAVRNITDAIVLYPFEGHKRHLQAWPEQNETGPPYQYRIFGHTIELYPIPEATTQLQVEYRAYSAALAADADVPVFPEPFHDLLVDGALSYAYEDDGNGDNADRAQRRYQASLDAMKFAMLGARQDRHFQIVDDFFG